MKKFFAVIMTLCLMAGILAIPSFAANTDPATVISGSTEISLENKAVLEAQYGTPTIDGQIDDVWTTTPWYQAPGTGRTSTGNGDAVNGYMAMLWDEANYYVIVYVNGWANFEGDGSADRVDIGFNVGMGYDTSIRIGDAEWLSPKLWMVEYSLNPNNTNWWQWCYKGFNKLDVASLGAFNQLSNDSFVLEFKFPVSSLFTSKSDMVGQVVPNSDGSKEIEILDYAHGWSNATGEKVGLNLQLVDKNGSNTTVQKYGLNNSYDIPSSWMTFTLKGEIPSQGGDDNQGGNDNQGGDDNQGGTSEDNGETADATSLVVFLGTVALAGAVIVSKKRH